MKHKSNKVFPFCPRVNTITLVNTSKYSRSLRLRVQPPTLANMSDSWSVSQGGTNETMWHASREFDLHRFDIQGTGQKSHCENTIWRYCNAVLRVGVVHAAWCVWRVALRVECLKVVCCVSDLPNCLSKLLVSGRSVGKWTFEALPRCGPAKSPTDGTLRDR